MYDMLLGTYRYQQKTNLCYSIRVINIGNLLFPTGTLAM